MAISGQNDSKTGQNIQFLTVWQHAIRIPTLCKKFSLIQNLSFFTFLIQMIERFAVRIYDPNGVIVPHKEFEIQSGIARFDFYI